MTLQPGNRVRLLQDAGHGGTQADFPTMGAEGFIVLKLVRSERSQVQFDGWDGSWLIEDSMLEKINDN